MQLFDGQMFYAKKSGTYKNNEILVTPGSYAENNNSGINCPSPYKILMERICRGAERGAIKDGEHRFMNIDERIDYQSELMDLPCIIRNKIPINQEISEDKKNFMKSRRIVVQPIAVDELTYTQLRIPSELFHLPFEGGCVIQFEKKDSTFKYNGVNFNHVSILNLGKGKYHLASYSEEGFGPLQYEFSLSEISDEESIIKGKYIEENIMAKFANILDVAKFNDRGQMILSAEDQKNFVHAYFGNYAKVIDESHKSIKSYKTPMGYGIDADPLYSSIYTTFVQFALDEVGFSTISNPNIEKLEDQFYSFGRYWYEMISSIFRLVSLLNFKELDEPPFKVSESFVKRSKETGGIKKSIKKPYLLISSNSDSTRNRGPKASGKTLKGSVLVLGHTRRQWIKNTEKYNRIHYRKRLIEGDFLTSPYVIKWIKWFWKGKEKENIITSSQINVGSKESSISFHENRMAEILRLHFGKNFFHDKHHNFLIGRENNRYRLDGLVDNDGIKFAVEIDGLQHFEYVPIFHKKGETDLELQKKSDEEKNKLCEEVNIPLVRIDSREWDGGEDSFWKLVLPELPDILCTRIRELIFD
jgi:hypothetical protein